MRELVEEQRKQLAVDDRKKKELYDVMVKSYAEREQQRKI